MPLPHILVQEERLKENIEKAARKMREEAQAIEKHRREVEVREREAREKERWRSELQATSIN